MTAMPERVKNPLFFIHLGYLMLSASPLVGQLLVDFTNIQFQVKDLLALDI